MKNPNFEETIKIANYLSADFRWSIWDDTRNLNNKKTEGIIVGKASTMVICLKSI